MLHRDFLVSEVILFSGFTVQASLREERDGYDIALIYTRKGRRVAWAKGKIENNAVNQAREELIERLAELGWRREVDMMLCRSRWYPPEKEIEHAV